MPVRSVPGSASVATLSQGKMVSPSANRNRDVIIALLRQAGVTQGSALELASGTGQHIVAFASAFPDVNWQPSDVDENRRKSIDAYVSEAALSNLMPSRTLDATAKDWARTAASPDLILLVNLLHLISEPEAKTLLYEASAALRPGGKFLIYGPFTRQGLLISEGDRSFDASLKAHDSDIGYKDDQDVRSWAELAGFSVSDVQELPANNLAFVLEKPHG